MAKTTWQIDPAHSEVVFRVRHLVVSTVSGRFRTISSTVTTEGDDFTTAQVDFTADTASIDTGLADRDAHLRSDDFFNSDQFPQLRFRSTAIRSTGENTYQLEGDLTIRDVTKPIRLNVEYGGMITDPWGNVKAGFEVTGSIRRKEYGLRWDVLTEAGGAVVSDEVKIQCNIEYTKTPGGEVSTAEGEAATAEKA
jgi:polyisoprenoid-binding protein YceI